MCREDERKSGVSERTWCFFDAFDRVRPESGLRSEDEREEVLHAGEIMDIEPTSGFLFELRGAGWLPY